MSTSRPCTLVVDFSVMPSRPGPSAVQEFIYKKVQLEQADALSIQLHNIRNCVYIQMPNSEKPLQYQRAHNYKHTMLADNGREYKIPVYSEDGAVTVRIHDLPPSISNTSVHAHMSQYGRVSFVGSEHWRNFFGGIKNGVRILRMHLNKSIPSFIKIDGEETLVTHDKQQVKTCRFCDKPVHPKSKCGVASQWKEVRAASQQATQSQAPISSVDFPELELNKEKQRDAQLQQRKQQQVPKQPTKQQTDDDDDDSENDSSSSVTINANNKPKRRLTTAKGNNNKKPCQSTPTADVTTKNCFVLLSPVHGSTEDTNENR